MKQDMIVILDLGSTENTVLARDIRALGVYSEIYPHDITVDELKALENVKGIILNGGENRVVDGVEIEVRPELYDLGYPMFSVDYPASKCETKLDKLPTADVLKTFLFDTCKAEANWNTLQRAFHKRFEVNVLECIMPKCASCLQNDAQRLGIFNLLVSHYILS